MILPPPPFSPAVSEGVGGAEAQQHDAAAAGFGSGGGGEAVARWPPMAFYWLTTRVHFMLQILIQFDKLVSIN